MKFNKNIGGFSLVELIVAIGVSGIIGGGVAGIMHLMHSHKGMIETEEVIHEWANEVTKILGDYDACTTSFTANTIAATNGTAVPLLWTSKATPSNVFIGATGPKGTSISAISIENITPLAGSDLSLQLQVVYDIKGVTQTRWYPFTAMTDGTNLVACKAIYSEDDFHQIACSSLGGNYTSNIRLCEALNTDRTTGFDFRRIFEQKNKLQSTAGRFDGILDTLECDLCTRQMAGTTNLDHTAFCSGLPGCFCTYLLSPSTHCEADCTAAGGAIVNIGAGNICRFNAGTCPGGWFPYPNWTTTSSQSLAGVSCASAPTCVSGSHTWSNTPVESVPRTLWTISSDPSCPPDGKGGFTPCCNDTGTPEPPCTALVTQIGCI